MNLNHIYVETLLDDGHKLDTPMSYQVFGPSLGSAPIVLVNHALTGNSSVTGPDGWWNHLIGENKIVDTNRFTVLAFDIPGNGYDGNLINDYKKLNIKAISSLFLKGLTQLNIKQIHTLMGGSLGGSIAWQMAYDQPDLFDNLVPIATDYTTTEWLRAQCYIQDILLNSKHHPLQNARKHAMLVYRTPESINAKFEDKHKSPNKNVEDWLNYHGEALHHRYDLKAYQLMNHLLSTIHITNDYQMLKKIKSNIHLVAIDSDLLFLAHRSKELYHSLKKGKENIYYHEIHSIHGHDAFLIEYEQLNQILKPIFNN